MVDVTVHFRGGGKEQRALLAVPAVGSYLYGPGAERRLWVVEAVLFDGEAVNVYVIEVATGLAVELMAQWSAWGASEVSSE